MIKLTEAVQWGGVTYAPGATIPGLSAADEAGFVASNRAEWVGQPATTNAVVPVQAAISPGGGIELSAGDHPIVFGGNVQRIRRVTDFYDNQDAAAVTFAVGANGESAGFNTSIGNAGETPYGRRAVRLTTAAINGSFAEVTVKQVNNPYLQNLAHIDPAMPFVILIAPHTTNNGSHLKLSLAATDATDAGNARVHGDIYIDNLHFNGEQQAVVAFQYDMRSMRGAGSGIDLTATLGRLRLQAFQEGTSGITDITILGVYQVVEKPMLHIGFDDGLKSVYDYAYPVLRDRDLIASVAVMGADVEKTPAARKAYGNLPLMVKPELDELIDAGWEMTVHGKSSAKGTTYAQLVDRLRAEKAAVEALGPEYRKSSSFYVYPGGEGNWVTDSDGEPIGPKAFRDAGFEHAALLYGFNKMFSYAFGGMGQAARMQDSLTLNMYRGPRNTIYETSNYATRIKTFEFELERLSAGLGFYEVLTHNVVPRAFFPNGQPYLADGYTGTVSTSNDTSQETLTAMMDLVAYYRDLGLIEVVKKRDWIIGVPRSLIQRKAMMRHWTR